MTYFETATKKIEQIIQQGGTSKMDLSKKIGISTAALEFFLNKKILLPANTVNKIYKYLDQEESKNKVLDTRIEIGNDNSSSSNR